MDIIPNVSTQKLSRLCNRLTTPQLLVKHKDDTNSLWLYMRPTPIPCFTIELLRDLNRAFDEVANYNHSHGKGIQYIVVASAIDGVFNLGGQLSLFLECIQEQDKPRLMQYARECVNACLASSKSYQNGAITIALVEGIAYGGGFEAALSCNLLIAEKTAKFAFPESLFQLFPGMGALNYLNRSVGLKIANKMIKDTKLYSPDELANLGVVDLVAGKGEGFEAVSQYLRKHQKQHATDLAVLNAVNRIDPISDSAMMQIADIWVDLAFQVPKQALKVMSRLNRTQSRHGWSPQSDALSGLVG